jgi:hypothetical protein
MNRQKRMDKARLCIPNMHHRVGWDNDVLETTVYVPLPCGNKQYVYSVNMQLPHQVWESLVMVHFFPQTSVEVLFDRFHVV